MIGNIKKSEFTYHFRYRRLSVTDSGNVPVCGMAGPVASRVFMRLMGAGRIKCN